MGKYAPLRDFLINQEAAVVPLTFKQIETLLGVSLPASKTSRAWWSNNPENNVMTREWLAAGFLSEAVDTQRETVVFRKRDEYPIIFPGESPEDLGYEATGLDPLFGCLRGSLKLLPDVDYTKPADPHWGRVYDND